MASLHAGHTGIFEESLAVANLDPKGKKEKVEAAKVAGMKRDFAPLLSAPTLAGWLS